MKLKDLEQDIQILESIVNRTRKIEPRVTQIQEKVNHLQHDMIDELHHMAHKEVASKTR